MEGNVAIDEITTELMDIWKQMQNYKGIFMTDQKGADGLSFSTGVLFDAVYAGSKESTPTCLTHDSHRMIGWSMVHGLYIAPDMDCVMGNTYIAENKEDLNQLTEFRKVWINNQVAVPWNKYGKSFQEELLRAGVLPVENEVILHYCSIVMLGYDGIVGKAFPDLLKIKDKYGQIKLRELEKDFDYLGAGVFKDKKSDLAIMLHPYLRKSLSRLNNYNIEFLEAFFAYRNSKDVDLEVTIDEDFIGYAPSFLMPSEFEHIYGAPFDDDVSKINTGPARYDNTPEDHQYYQSLRTEYNWKWEGGEFTFEMEDLNDFSMPGALNKEYGCYYVHSQYDFNNQVFKHFDGAVREYDEAEMLERLDLKLKETGKDKKYTKLFRMDGKIPIQEWKFLIMKYTYGLPSVYEYFGQQRPVIPIGKEEPKPAIYNYVPYKLNEDDGIRLYIAYKSAEDTDGRIRWIDSCDVLTTSENKKHDVIEEKAKDLIDHLNENGAAIKEKEGCLYIDAGDNYANIPVIAHGNKDSLEDDVNQTWQGICSYVDKAASGAPFMTYAFTLAWPMKGRMVQFSFAGNVKELNTWMKNTPKLPVGYEDFRKWIEKQSELIHKVWAGVKSFERDKMINDDGILYFKRRNIMHDIDASQIVRNEDGSLTIKTENKELNALLESGLVFICSNRLDGKCVCCNWSTKKIE